MRTPRSLAPTNHSSRIKRPKTRKRCATSTTKNQASSKILPTTKSISRQRLSKLVASHEKQSRSKKGDRGAAGCRFLNESSYSDPERPEFTPPGVLTYIRTAQEQDALLWIDADKKAVTESPVRILRAAACDKETPASAARDDHHELVAEATRIVQEERRDTRPASSETSAALAIDLRTPAGFRSPP